MSLNAYILLSDSQEVSPPVKYLYGHKVDVLTFRMDSGSISGTEKPGESKKKVPYRATTAENVKLRLTSSPFPGLASTKRNGCLLWDYLTRGSQHHSSTRAIGSLPAH